VEGDAAFIESCTVTDPDLHGISVNGLQPFISKNKVSWIGADDDCIVVMNATSGGTVQGNRCTDSVQLGILVDNCNSLTISGNKIERVGAKDDASLRISGNSNSVSGNTIKEGGNDGIRLDGDMNSITGNKVTNCVTDGIHVVSGTGNVISGNTANGNMGEGIDNGGDATVCASNTAKKNRTDITNDGTFADFTDNKFETGGEAVPPQVD
jgi:parallel beta-helix repeat protein